MVPILVRYFDKCAGIKVKVLEFCNVCNETAETLSGYISTILNKYKLSDKVIAFSADNTNTNFGGIGRKGKNNVYQKLKEKLGRNILGIGCGAHKLHNSVQSASDCLPHDVEVILFKIYKHFEIFTVQPNL